jgi:hypothetical protein
VRLSWHIQVVVASRDAHLDSFNCINADPKKSRKNPEEKQRIEGAGGVVNSDRVDGELAVARAVGDSRYKGNPRVATSRQKVVPEPEVTHLTVSEGDFLLLACDGYVAQLCTPKLNQCSSRDDSMSAHRSDPIVPLLMHALAPPCIISTAQHL